MRLAEFNNDAFDRGRPRIVEACWLLLEGLLFNSWLPGSVWRVCMLRLFGATVGRGVVIKPRVRIKFPWKLKMGEDSWIGEGVWIDNLGNVEIGSDCCLSQGAYLCAGSHDWTAERFDLRVKPVVLNDKVWIAAFARVGPGVTAGEGAVLCFGGVATGDLDAWTIYSGNPACAVKQRRC